VYNINTPDLYENNAHHKIGWIATWIVTAQVIMSLLFTYSGRGKKSAASASERAAFLPMSAENMTQHNLSSYADCRWSGDSGHGTEASSTLNSRDASPTNPNRRDTLDDFEKPDRAPELDDDDDEDHNDDDEELLSSSAQSPRWGWLRIKFIDKHLSARLPNLLSAKFLRILEVVYAVIDRTILLLGFIALTTGGVTYAGIFVSAAAQSRRKRRSLSQMIKLTIYSEATTSSTDWPISSKVESSFGMDCSPLDVGWGALQIWAGHGTSSRPAARKPANGKPPSRPPNLSSLLSFGSTARRTSSSNIWLLMVVHGLCRIWSMCPSRSCSLVAAW
jgi:hypothetical protein